MCVLGTSLCMRESFPIEDRCHQAAGITSVRSEVAVVGPEALGVGEQRPDGGMHSVVVHRGSSSLLQVARLEQVVSHAWVASGQRVEC